MFRSNVLISLEAEKNPLLPIKNPHKSNFGNFFYERLKVVLFALCGVHFVVKILLITKAVILRHTARVAYAFLKARVSYYKWSVRDLTHAYHTDLLSIFVRQPASMLLYNSHDSADHNGGPIFKNVVQILNMLY